MSSFKYLVSVTILTIIALNIRIMESSTSINRKDVLICTTYESSGKEVDYCLKKTGKIYKYIAHEKSKIEKVENPADMNFEINLNLLDNEETVLGKKYEVYEASIKHIINENSTKCAKAFEEQNYKPKQALEDDTCNGEDHNLKFFFHDTQNVDGEERHEYYIQVKNETANDNKCIRINKVLEQSHGEIYSRHVETGGCNERSSLWYIVDKGGVPTSPPHTTTNPIIPQPTFSKDFEEISHFSNKLLLLKQLGVDGESILGLGMSNSNTGNLSQPNDYLQLKSFDKNLIEDKYISKMLWSLDEETNHISLSNQPNLNVYVKHKYSFAELEVLKKSDKHARWKLQSIGETDGYKIVTEIKIGEKVCLTVHKCFNPEKKEGKMGLTHYNCLSPNSKNDQGLLSPACDKSENSCDEQETVSKYNTSIDKLQPGAYIRAMECKENWDPSQLFYLHDINEFGEEVPPPTNKPTNKPTNIPPIITNVVEDVKSMKLALILLLVCAILLIITIVCVLRKRNKKKYENSYGEGQNRVYGTEDFQNDDNDDQEVYNSFDSVSHQNNLSERLTTTNTTNNTEDAGLVERMLTSRKRSSSLKFEPHVSHFEQEQGQGFVARV